MVDLARTDATGLRRLLDERQIGAVELTRACLERIERLDGGLNAFVRLNPRALDEARAAEQHLASGRGGPLTGLPVALKDNLCTAGLETTCGSRVLEGFRPLVDATAVQRLREAGAVVLGKTNLDEFAMGSSCESGAAGPAHNPWDPSRVAGGSSGGSAVAVAAAMVPLALGSDTGGSIRQPAAFCGVVGFKPTYGRVSRSGLVAYGSSLDQIGPLSRSVRDAALVLEVIAGQDPADATSAARPVPRYTAACQAGIAGVRVGLPREYLDERADPEIAGAVHAAADRLAREGAEIEEITLPHTRYAIPAYYLIATAEASSNLARYDGVRYGRRNGAEAGLRAMYRRSRAAGFGIEVQRRVLLGTFALSAGYHEAFYGRAQRARTLIRRDFSAVFDAGLRAILCPVTPAPAFRIGEKVGDPVAMYLSDVYTVPANLAGLPALALPLGRNRAGLPLGGQLVAREFDEEALLGLGAVLERAFPPELPPCAA